MKGDETRDLFIRTAARLFQAQGFHGVGLAQLIQESGAPKGSFYYHFPDGKEQLALAAIAYSDRDVLALLSYAKKTSPAPDRYVRAISKGLKIWLTESDYSAGCPVAGFTLELAAGSEAIASACKAAYAGWIDAIADALAGHGLPGPKSRDFAVGIVSSFEGGVILARAVRSARPLDQVSHILALALQSEI